MTLSDRSASTVPATSGSDTARPAAGTHVSSGSPRLSAETPQVCSVDTDGDRATWRLTWPDGSVDLCCDRCMRSRCWDSRPFGVEPTFEDLAASRDMWGDAVEVTNA